MGAYSNGQRPGARRTGARSCSWEPPRRLRYLWHLRADRTDATEVEVAFTGQDDGSTRVDIEHRGWDRLGERAPAWRERNQRGWSGIIPTYVAACTG